MSSMKFWLLQGLCFKLVWPYVTVSICISKYNQYLRNQMSRKRLKKSETTGLETTLDNETIQYRETKSPPVNWHMTCLNFALE